MSHFNETQHLVLALPADGIDAVIALDGKTKGRQPSFLPSFQGHVLVCFVRGGSNNMSRLVTNAAGLTKEVEAQDWRLVAAGNESDVLRFACRHATAALDGSVRINGRDVMPETYIKRYRQAISEPIVAPDLVTAFLAGISMEMPVRRMDLNDPHPWLEVARQEGRLGPVEDDPDDGSAAWIPFTITRELAARRIAADVAMLSYYLVRSPKRIPHIAKARINDRLDDLAAKYQRSTPRKYRAA